MNLEEYRQNRIKRIESDSSLSDEHKQDLIEQVYSEEYIFLDESKKIATSVCVHRWIKDSDNHKVCEKCGYGRYI